MIKLTNGFEVKYTEDFDKFFQNLLEAIIYESKQSSLLKKSNPEETKTEKDLFLQEIMDNCIYVTHQLFTLYKSNEKFTKFIITGFIFNSIILSLSNFSDIVDPKKPGDDGIDTLH
ncbi:MAG TPA: hypothetical protein PKG60_12605 [Spirochaetota bacterium]|nr:hypothetical protein [Spirochaetota bacterium]HPS86975.1 hypothetical protein [Spirochaetota bacterium]